MQHRIRTIMERTGLTQQQFAERIKISPSTLSNIFNGKTQPTNKLFSAIHQTFPDINVNWLLFGEGEMHLSSPAIASVVGDSRVPFPADPNPAPVALGNSEPDLFSSIPDDELTPMVGAMPSTLSSSSGLGPNVASVPSSLSVHPDVMPEGDTTNGRLNGSAASVGGHQSTVVSTSNGRRQTRRTLSHTPAVQDIGLSMKNIDKITREIKEIRVFFSDGTYESFVPAK